MFDHIGPSYSLEGDESDIQIVHREYHDTEEGQSDEDEGDDYDRGEEGGWEIRSDENGGNDVKRQGEQEQTDDEIEDEGQDDSVSVLSQRGKGKRKSKAMRKKSTLKNAVKKERKLKQAAERAARKKLRQTGQTVHQPTSSNKPQYLASRKGYLKNKSTFRFLLRARFQHILPQEVGRIAELHYHHLKPVQEHIEAHAAFPKLKEVVLYWRRWRRAGTCDEQFGESCKMVNILGVDLTYGYLMAEHYRHFQHEQVTPDHQAIFHTLTIELDRLLALHLPEEWGQRIQ